MYMRVCFCLSPSIVSFISFHFIFLLFITDVLIGGVEKVEITPQQNMGNTRRRILVVEGEHHQSMSLLLLFIIYLRHHRQHGEPESLAAPTYNGRLPV